MEYGYCERFKGGRKEGNVLFNDALNTFYLRLHRRKNGRKCLFNDALNTFYFLLYGVRHMVNDVHVLDQMEMFCLQLSDMIKDHSDNERGNSLLPFDTL